MQNIRLHPAFLFSLLLVAACATPDAFSLKRGTPCSHKGELIVDGTGALLICTESSAECTGQSVWGIVGIDTPIMGTEIPNTSCPKVGELARTDDGGMLLVCTKSPMTQNNGNGNNHAH